MVEFVVRFRLCERIVRWVDLERRVFPVGRSACRGDRRRACWLANVLERKDRKSNRTRSCREARKRLQNPSCKATRAWLVLNRERDGETLRSM